MPKNTKELADKTNVSTKNAVKSTTKKTAPKVAKEASSRKVTKTTTAKVAKKEPTKKVTKSTTPKTSKKAPSKKTTKTSTVKSVKKVAKKAPAKKTANTKKVKKSEIIEYYDLPYRYNQTIVKILAQTPTTLFVYWDISDSDREKYVNEFGENFFNSTYPVLIVHNKTMNYSFEIEINDFANSWYFNVENAKCDYEIELGRRSRRNDINLPNNYMHITSSNTIEVPNNHVLFEKSQKVLFFRNVKSNTTFSKDISQFDFMRYMGRVYSIYDVYKKIYKNQELQDVTGNPSSKFNEGAF